MGLLGKVRELRWRAAGHYSRILPPEFLAPLHGACALEIGGPSAVFGAAGLLRAYDACASVDNVQFQARTTWHELEPEAAFRPDGRPIGRQLIIDDVELASVPDGAYEATLSSHVIEHFANPLRALAAWRRVCVPEAHVLMVAPHMAGTFDRRRAVTALGHMIADFERGVGEDDLTHLEETLRLHDHRRDTRCADRAGWEAARRDNVNTRLLHHHVFTTPSLLGLLDRAGLQLLAVETRFPHDIYVLGRFARPGNPPDNAAFLATRRPSPFRVDRVRPRAATAPPSASSQGGSH
jgi:SAM-dependent methyltransferase